MGTFPLGDVKRLRGETVLGRGSWRFGAWIATSKHLETCTHGVQKLRREALPRLQLGPRFDPARLGPSNRTCSYQVVQESLLDVSGGGLA